MLVYQGGTLVSGSSKKQGTVAGSSKEAEYQAIANTIEELEVVKAFLTELGIEIPLPLQLMSEQQHERVKDY